MAYWLICRYSQLGFKVVIENKKEQVNYEVNLIFVILVAFVGEYFLLINGFEGNFFLNYIVCGFCTSV